MVVMDVFFVVFFCIFMSLGAKDIIITRANNREVEIVFYDFTFLNSVDEEKGCYLRTLRVNIVRIGLLVVNWL